MAPTQLRKYLSRRPVKRHIAKPTRAMWKTATVLLLPILTFVHSFTIFAPAQFAIRKEGHNYGPAIATKSGTSFALFSSEIDDDDEDVEPGKMRVSEIKAELDLRGVSYADCFDKESMAQRLEEARVTGKANPKIMETFNKQKLESTFNEDKVELKDEDIDQTVSNDGTLPGGMDPEVFKKLIGNPEIMQLLQSTKMQEAMKLMMTGGKDELDAKLRGDPELRDIVDKLEKALGSVQ